eukprot:5587024-Pyramimonas_sp.AAC.1
MGVCTGNIPQIDQWDESARGIFHTSANHLALPDVRRRGVIVGRVDTVVCFRVSKKRRVEFSGGGVAKQGFTFYLQLDLL